MNTDEQKARAQLRLGFLNTVKALSGRQASIVTAEGNTVTAVLVGVDRDSALVGVESLVTPAGTLPQATLRLADMDYMELRGCREK